MRILYILNNCGKEFGRQTVIDSLDNPKLLPTLLQHARDTHSQKRTLNLQFIISVLLKNNLNFSNLLVIEIPDIFIESIKNKDVIEKEEACCKAPWCTNYNLPKGFVMRVRFIL